MPLWARLVLRLAWVAALGGSLLRHASALADVSPSRPAATILLMAAEDDPTTTRVAAEIRAAGLAIKSVQGVPATGPDSDVALQSRLAQAVGAVEIDAGTGQVWIWTVDESSGQIVLRSVVRISDDPAVVALRVVEALRASLKESDWFVPPKIAPPVVPAPYRASAPVAATPRWSATLGPAIAWGGTQFGGSLEGLGSLYGLWSPRWGAEILGVFPLTDAQRVVSAGSGTLAFGLVAGGVRARALTTDWCALDVSLGVGAAVIHTEGFPKVGFAGSDSTTWVAAPYTRIGYGLAIVPHFWLLADIAGSFAIPRPNFTFAGEAASWGTPLLLASLGVEVVFR
jgi:hypothetical protein